MRRQERREQREGSARQHNQEEREYPLEGDVRRHVAGETVDDEDVHAHWRRDQPRLTTISARKSNQTLMSSTGMPNSSVMLTDTFTHAIDGEARHTRVRSAQL